MLKQFKSGAELLMGYRSANKPISSLISELLEIIIIGKKNTNKEGKYIKPSGCEPKNITTGDETAVRSYI